MKLQTRKPITTSLRSDERGLASFIVTLILILVITLIVLGFAGLTRRNQREALDNQLSTQAYYAAETGVNLVRNLMGSTPADQLTKTKCQPLVSDNHHYVNQQLNDSSNQVVNSCLIVNDAPSSLEYDTIDANNTVVPIQASPDTAHGSGTLTLTWQSKDTSPGPVSNCSTNSNYDNFTRDLSNGGGNCPYGVLRFDMVDVTAAGGLTPQNLENKTVAVYAPPTSDYQAIFKNEGNGSIGVSIGHVRCVSAPTAQCTLTISGVNYSHLYYMRITSLYKTVKLDSITGINADGAPVQFIGAQLLVDSTGKAVDVLRRVQVRLDESRTLSPAYAIESQSGICKLYTTTGPGSSLSGSCP